MVGAPRLGGFGEAQRVPVGSWQHRLGRAWIFLFGRVGRCQMDCQDRGEVRSRDITWHSFLCAGTHLAQLARNGDSLGLRVECSNRPAWPIDGLLHTSLTRQILFGLSSVGASVHQRLMSLQVKPRSKLDDAAFRGLMTKDLRPRPITDDYPEHARILNFVVSAGNTVLTKKAITDLSG